MRSRLSRATITQLRADFAALQGLEASDALGRRQCRYGSAAFFCRMAALHYGFDRKTIRDAVTNHAFRRVTATRPEPGLAESVRELRGLDPYALEWPDENNNNNESEK